LFWTVPLATNPPVELGNGTAHLSATDLVVADYFNIPNALSRFQTPSLWARAAASTSNGAAP
jgi:hypothetical protein